MSASRRLLSRLVAETLLLVAGVLGGLQLLVGCVSPSSQTTVRLAGDVNQDVLDGAYAWTELGFLFFTVDEPADITVTFDRRPNVWDDRGPAYTHIDTGIVVIDDLLYYAESDQMPRMAAHEIGHVLLQTSEHLEHGLGVMSAPPLGARLTEADRELAARLGVAR